MQPAVPTPRAGELDEAQGVAWLLVVADESRQHFCGQTSVRSTKERRAGWRLLLAWSSFSSPIRRMCGTPDTPVFFADSIVSEISVSPLTSQKTYP